MTKTDSTQVKWRVQYRQDRRYKWRNAGLYETRERARQEATYYREGDGAFPGYGFGNSRVVRHVRGAR